MRLSPIRGYILNANACGTLNYMTLQYVADIFGVSRERVRQVITQLGLKKKRAQIKNRGFKAASAIRKFIEDGSINNKTYKEMSALSGFSQGSLMSAYHALGLKRRIPRNGITANGLSIMLGMSRMNVYYHIQQGHIKATKHNTMGGQGYWIISIEEASRFMAEWITHPHRGEKPTFRKHATTTPLISLSDGRK